MKKRLCLAVALAAASLSLLLGGFLAGAAQAQAPDICAPCHTSEHEEWLTSGHAASGQSRAFLGLLDQVPASVDRQSCLRCHAPLSGPEAGSGVSCQVCHFIEAVEGIGNGDFVWSEGGGVRGLHGLDAPHTVTASELFADSRFCGACHEQYDVRTGVLLQGTYTEWLNSPAALQGVACQDCHMEDGGTVSHAMGAPADDGEAKASALAAAISMTVQAPDAVRASGHVVAEVIVENEGAGHRLPTGKREAGEMWLHAKAIGDDGRILYEESLPYGVVFADSEGAPLEGASLWGVASILSDHRLNPSQPMTEQFAFAVPIDASGEVLFSVELLYRPTPAWLSTAMSLPESASFTIHQAALPIRVLPPRPTPTYVPPTPEPTSVPPLQGGDMPTGSLVRLEDRGWLLPFAAAGGALLLLAALWALYRKAV